MARLKKLRLKIIEKFDTCSRFADEMEMNHASLSNKINGKTEFTASEINKACELLKIPESKISEFFLSK